jgi:transcriptional regulator with XRE-family HTH domain
VTRNSSEFDLGSRLAAIRSRRALSQGTTARLSGLSASYLSRIETGHVHPTFSLVLRVMNALHADLDELVAADRIRPPHRAACPVTEHGHCLIQLVRNDPRVARAEGKEVYSPREIHLLGQLATFMRTAPPERVRAIEILIEELIGKTSH